MAIGTTSGDNAPAGGAVREFASPYEEVVMALVSQASGAGLAVESVNSAAGEILASEPSGAKLVFAIRASGAARTRVAAAPLGTTSVRAALLQELFRRMDTSLSRRGAL